MSELDQILTEAIRGEREACALYTDLAGKARDAAAKALLEGLAADESRHERQLSALSADEMLDRKIPEIGDLRISDFLEEQKITPDSSFQQVLIFAAKKENSSWRTYRSLAGQAEDERTRQLFERLAAEEMGHKARLEQLYDELIYRED